MTSEGWRPVRVAWLGGNAGKVGSLPSSLQRTFIYVRVHVNITLCKLCLAFVHSYIISIERNAYQRGKKILAYTCPGGRINCSFTYLL